MRNLLILPCFFFFTTLLVAQNNPGILLISGKDDTKTFLKDYLNPGTEGLLYNLSGGWYQTAEVKNTLGFEISVIANASVNLDQHQSFILNTDEYQNLHFPDGSTSKSVATILGNNDPAVRVILKNKSTSDDEETSLDLPQGLESAGIEFIPSAFLQARLGIIKGTEVKLRYLPRRDFGGTNFQILGGAIQHEVTQWLAPELFPLTISGMLAYSAVDGNYNFTEDPIVQGENQRLNSKINCWMFSGIVSTRFPLVNFYGGVSYLTGTTKTHLLGTYSFEDQNPEDTVTLEDPVSVTGKASGLTANLGIALGLGFFKLHGEYNFSEYQTISAGVHIGF